VFNDLDLSKCPDLKGKKSVVLNYAGTDETKAPKNNQWIGKKGIWIKKELEPAEEEGLYTLTLMGEKLYTIPVRVALQGQDLERAKAKYEQALAEYKRNVAALMDAKANRAREEAFMRTMRIANMGIHNYDLLMKRDNVVPLAADFDLPGYNDIKEKITVFMITNESRSVIKLPYYSWKKFRFDPKQENTIVSVLPGDRIGLFTQKDFEKQAKQMIAAQGQQYTFEMAIQDGIVESEEDLRGLLEESDS